jgi:predicted  nucleic acid-binding Zn-ribbon protein
MTIDNTTLENLRALMRAELAEVRAEMRAEFTNVRAELADVKGDIRAIRADIGPMRAQLDGLPLLQRNLTITQQEVRSLKAAFNDFALTNVTKGEIESLHSDVNRVQAENAILAVRMETAERLIREIQETLGHH